METRNIGVFEAKTRLSEILQDVQKGVRFIITRRHRPIAELGPIHERTRPLERGCAANAAYRMAPDFDEPLDDLRDYL